MKIHFTQHTIERAKERGISLAEIQDVIINGDQFSAKHGRFGKLKIFPFESWRQDVYYNQKRVEVIYVIEGETITVITVYAFYGRWHGNENIL